MAPTLTDAVRTTEASSCQHGHGQGEHGRGECRGDGAADCLGSGVAVRGRRGGGAPGGAARWLGAGARRGGHGRGLGRGSRGGGDADVDFLAGGAVAREAAEEIVVASGVEDDRVVARRPGGDRLRRVAVLVVRLAHRHHVVELLQVSEHNGVAGMELLGGGPGGVVGVAHDGPPGLVAHLVHGRRRYPRAHHRRRHRRRRHGRYPPHRTTHGRSSSKHHTRTRTRERAASSPLFFLLHSLAVGRRVRALAQAVLNGRPVK
uniref:Uncharacterized protein n=1 Tax=Arundo donax TaxID=35708 RepID=A0A0A9DL98_ARUDO